MSDPTATMQHMTTLERLIAAKADQTTVGRIDYLDILNTYAVALVQRPGDWERVSLVLDQLITRLHEAVGADLSAEQHENALAHADAGKRLTEAHTA